MPATAVTQVWPVGAGVRGCPASARVGGLAGAQGSSRGRSYTVKVHQFRKGLLMSEGNQVLLDELGNILLPTLLRERLHLAPGTVLVVEKGDDQGGVRLRIQSKPTVPVEQDGFLVARVTALGNLADAVRRERDRQVFDPWQ